ncbi:MAG TPA: DUF5955 family protein [Streptomyces sp.]
MGETQVLDDDRSGTAARAAADGTPGGTQYPAGPGAGLRTAVARLRRELSAYRPQLPDRAVAEDGLAALDHQAAAADEASGLVDIEHLRHSLLLVAAALGSVSALAAPVNAVREAVEDMVLPR